MIDYRPILAAYRADCQPIDPRGGVVALEGAGGFSGAMLWRVAAARGDLALRRWPAEHPTKPQLAFIHSVLRHVHGRGFTRVPVPLLSRGAESFIAADGTLWELAPWLPGKADFSASPSAASSAARLIAALRALAEFHVAAASFPSYPRHGGSPGLARRRDELRQIRDGGWHELEQALDTKLWPELAARGREWINLFHRHAEAIERRLEVAAARAVPLQPCQRDIWHDHVLFVGDEVTGLIDFGAMRVESVAGDIARLLGSLVGDDRARREVGLAAYRAVRPLNWTEESLVDVFDESATLLTGAQWLRWVFLQRRKFADRAGVVRRFDVALGRIAKLTQAGMVALESGE